MANPPLRAAVWMIGAIVSFSAMAVAGRAVSFELDTFELLLYRSLIGIVIVLAVARFAGTVGQINTLHFPTHLIRNTCHFIGQNLWYFALTAIPLAQVFALEFTSPLWVIALSPLLLGERLTRVRVLAGITGFIGVLIVAQPSPDTLSWGLGAAALSAICFAGTAIFTQKLTRHTTLTNILFWLVVMQAVFGLICAGYDGDIQLPSSVTAPWLMLIGTAGLLAHFCVTKALTIAPASTVMPFDFVRLPLIAIVGALFYSEPLNMYVFIGAAIIFLANTITIRASVQEHSAKW
ncbi:multidrug DMT transporter permease [Marinosulfonomonas sp. PRT-SC04]|nr:multidrug DMT transporter permease [Marinosulfonomonas sp. PRT-SC04]